MVTQHFYEDIKIKMTALRDLENVRVEVKTAGLTWDYEGKFSGSVNTGMSDVILIASRPFSMVPATMKMPANNSEMGVSARLDKEHVVFFRGTPVERMLSFGSHEHPTRVEIIVTYRGGDAKAAFSFQFRPSHNPAPLGRVRQVMGIETSDT